MLKQKSILDNMKKNNKNKDKLKSSENIPDESKYKYHQSQKEEDKAHNDAYPDKPDNHPKPEERLLNPDKGD